MSLRRLTCSASLLGLVLLASFAQGNPDDVIDSHHVGLGVVATKGRIQGSYFEAGYGRTDLFAAPNNKGRWKLDGRFTIQIIQWMNFFAQLTADTDFGHGCESVQSYNGVEFDIKKLVISLLPQSAETLNVTKK